MNKIKMPKVIQQFNVPINAWHEANAFGYIRQEMDKIDTAKGKSLYIDPWIYRKNRGITYYMTPELCWIWKEFIIPHRKELKNMLEVGSGRGFIGISFASRGFKYTGVDIALACVAFGESLKTTYKNPNMNFIQMCAEDLKFPDRYFDFVYSQHLWEHTHILDKAVSEQFRVGKWVAGIIPVPFDSETSEHLHKINYEDVVKYVSKYSEVYQVKKFLENEKAKVTAFWARSKGCP